MNGVPPTLPRYSLLPADKNPYLMRAPRLARKAQELFLIQPAREKRRLLNFLLSNCTWKGGELDATFRQPFDMLSDTTKAHRSRSLDAGVLQPDFEKWLPGLDSN